MLNLLAAMDSGTIVILVVGVVLLVGMFIFNYFASKKQRQAESDRLKNLKVGDRVLMSCGIQGTIVEINEISPVDTNVVVRTGNIDEPCTLTFDVRAVYQTLNSANAETAENVETEQTVAASAETEADDNTAAESASETDIPEEKK